MKRLSTDCVEIMNVQVFDNNIPSVLLVVLVVVVLDSFDIYVI